MPAVAQPTPRFILDPDPDPDSDFGAAHPPRLSEAEVQSLTAVIHDVSGSNTAETNHWELDSMALLNAVSLAAIARLRSYSPPAFPLWDRLPFSRRAAVLILLYADRRGDLRVVLTMRAANMRSFSGHAAFPGGKADSIEESPYQIARREAWEEIGLPMDDAKVPAPFKIEFLCHLPHNLARTSLAVRPCVALLHRPPPTPAGEPQTAATGPSSSAPTPSVQSMIPRLDPREVAAVFSAPFANFLAADDLEPAGLPPGHWYDGSWISWKGHPWRVHNFYVPVNNQRVARPSRELAAATATGGLADGLEEEEVEVGRYKVWGMTAKILVDAAAVAYGRRPGFEHMESAGDEDLIVKWEEDGEFFDKGAGAGGAAGSAAGKVVVNGAEGDGDAGEPAKM